MGSLKEIAVLVSNLDRDLADNLLDHLQSNDAETIRSAILGLAHTDEIDQRATIESFLDSDSHVQAEANDHAQIKKTPADSEKDDSDHPLAGATNELLSRLLWNEQPQTIAVILSRLPASRASEIVSTLPAKLQPDILQRIVELDNSNLPDFDFVKREFENWLRTEIETGVQRVELISRMANVVESASTSTQHRILTNVAAIDSSMAQELRDQFGVDLESPTPR